MNLKLALVISTIWIPMFGFGKLKKEVSVEFIEQGADEAFARSVIPTDQLPETFEINTTLDIGEDKWSVVSAEPETKAEFSKNGKLKVYLAKIEYVNPADLLYSLPTISNELAELTETESLENVLIIREDDWRQIEFLSTTLSQAVKEELIAIRNIYDNERKGVGFKSLHVRERVPSPLKNRSLTFNSVVETFGVSYRYENLAFNTANAVIKDGFAFQSPLNITIWGQKNEEGIIGCLCFSVVEPNVDRALFSKTIKKFTESHELIFVDWVTTFTADSAESNFENYIKTKPNKTGDSNSE